MPVIPISWGGTSGDLLTDSCVLINSGGVYGRPIVNQQRISSSELETFIEGGTIFVRSNYPGIMTLCILRYRVMSDGPFRFHTIVDSTTFIPLFLLRQEIETVKSHFPRIEWLANYARIKRKTAFAMAGHPRLCDEGLLRMLGGDLLREIANQI